ncbi:hypothetical protein ACFLX0_01385 [Chloroflexota bacterium]
MAAKVVYLRIVQQFARFRLPKSEYKSTINFNAAVSVLHNDLAERYNKPKSTIAHLISSLGFQLFNEIEHEEGPKQIESILQGKVIVILNDNNKLQLIKLE